MPSKKIISYDSGAYFLDIKHFFNAKFQHNLTNSIKSEFFQNQLTFYP
jgi:hypothetical protein